MDSEMESDEDEEVYEWRKIKDEISCPICSDLFTDPKTAPCLHTFCKVCLKKSIEMNKRFNSDVCCPLCRAKLPQDDVDLIPTNFVTKRLVEIYDQQVQRRKSASTTRRRAQSTSHAGTDSAFSGDRFAVSSDRRPHSLYAANYSYSPRRDDELAFKEGDLFDVLNTEDHNWWLARNNNSGKVGRIPSNYISVVEFTKGHSSHITATGLTSKSKSNSSQQLFIAQYSYSPKRENELGFNEGDQLYVMSTDDPDWWLAKCKDSTRVGYVPSNYISENMLHQPNSKSDSSNKWSYSHHPVFIAKYSYSPRKKNELGFKEGDLFYIMNTDDPNWWLGKNKDLSGQVGYIPSNYIVKFGGNQIRVPQNQLKVADAEERKNPDSELIAYPPCVAKYSYSPRRESELGFNKGEKLYVINTDDANWWLAGQMGCIPSSYVSEFRTDQLQNESKANDSDRETNRKLEAVKACNLNYPLFIAKSNYSPRRDNELGFKEGDLMYVVNSEDCNWWIAGRVGYIPSNYVSLIDSNNSDRSFFGTNIDSSNYPLFIAKYNYTARTDFDLSFKKGDLLHIVRVDDDGWWLARRSNSQEGCIPSSYVKEYKSLLDAEDWYFGAISFKHAEEVLMQAPNDHGSFLICDCKKASSGFTLVVRVKSTIKRWRIDKSSNKKYFIHPDTAFESLQQLVEYYTEHTGEFSFEIIKTPCVPTEVYRTAGLSKATNKAWQIQRNSLKLCKKIDTGNFGEMWEAVWNNGTPVIVNTLNPGTITVSDFLKEATVMKQLRHRNVVQLYAVCVEEEPIYVVTELMEHGNLQDYLRGDGRALQLPQLINMGAQVAAGMAYLENNTYIHGNVTARSVFVSEHLICRIGDFGVINALAKDPSIKLTNTTPATKWAAPEVLLSSIFTVKSDVWSFGIFLHELVTYGQLPYHDKKDENLIEELKRGYRIPRPTNCPEQLHKIMIKCWNEDANSRPTFETLQWQLEEFFIDDVLYAVTTSTPYLPQ